MNLPLAPVLDSADHNNDLPEPGSLLAFDQSKRVSADLMPSAVFVRTAVEAAGARLIYLPSYSPDFNPIEDAFSKLKARLR